MQTPDIYKNLNIKTVIKNNFGISILILRSIPTQKTKNIINPDMYLTSGPNLK